MGPDGWVMVTWWIDRYMSFDEIKSMYRRELADGLKYITWAETTTTLVYDEDYYSISANSGTWTLDNMSITWADA